MLPAQSLVGTCKSLHDDRPLPKCGRAYNALHDTLSNGRTLRVLTVLAVYSRECVALEPGVGFRAADVASILSEAAEGRGKLPEVTSVDNGTEFTSTAASDASASPNTGSSP